MDVHLNIDGENFFPPFTPFLGFRVRYQIHLSTNMQVPLIRLQCGVNSYDWGKVGKDSAAAKFAAATPADDFTIQDKPYAEVNIDPNIITLLLMTLSYGWAHIPRIPPKISLQNELFSNLCKTIKPSYPQKSARGLDTSCHSSLKSYP